MRAAVIASYVLSMGLLLAACSPPEPPPVPTEKVAEAAESAFAVQEDTPHALRFNWHYQRFLEHLVNQYGRVIDNSGERSISTSEGQAYGMWFALLAQDQGQFDLMLQWANDNLAEGALGDRLPAWLWGEDEDGQWHILDANPASDADIWMAYALYAAAELWQEPRYAALAERISRRLLATSTIVLGGESLDATATSGDADSAVSRASSGAHSEGVQGLVLLPAPEGFVHENYIIVNPSYFSLVQLRGLAAYSGDARWQEIYQTSTQIIQQLANEGHGMVPDWLAVDYAGQVLTVAATGAAHQENVQHGDYDAIRTYLWLAQDGQLLNSFQHMYEFIDERGFPAERFTRPDGSGEIRGSSEERNGEVRASGRGNIGFSAVLLRYLADIEGDQGENVQEQLSRIVATNPNDYREIYYTQMLLMFGLSAVQCTEFHSNGTLVVSQEVLNGCT
ncbi:MAG: hypothetical protein LAT53_04595 [Idiomarina sp.]|nr:hypothetical protein [Idiomarina sp.]